MLRLFSTVTILAGLLMIGCRSARPAVSIVGLPNYDSQAPDHILFLNFRITGRPGGEQVELTSANAGVGKMKDISRPVHFPYQIKAVSRYSTGAAAQEMVFEHPLYRNVEVSDAEGHLRQQEAMAREGSLLVRLQLHPGVNQLDLFSVSPEKRTIQIYSLDLKQP